MYSPKISEDLIPKLYRIAKARRITMTKLVNNIVSEAIKDIKVETMTILVPREQLEEQFRIA